jgi:hypothetical protein
VPTVPGRRHPEWSYTYVLADRTMWVDLAAVPDLALHPVLGSDWPAARSAGHSALGAGRWALGTGRCSLISRGGTDEPTVSTASEHQDMRSGHGTSDHGTLADRHDGARPEQRRTPARHCHVGGEPSLLVEWRRGSSGWEGRVVSVSWIDAVGWATAERWLPAAQIVSV